MEDIQIRYGDRVVVKARAAREKYLTVPQMGAAVYGSKAQREPLEFTRSGLAALNCDDWEIIPVGMRTTQNADLDVAPRWSDAHVVPIDAGTNSENPRAPKSRGDYLCAGDRIALRSVECHELLVLNDDSLRQAHTGSRLMPSTAPEHDVPDDSAVWQVVIAGMPFIPAWVKMRRSASKKLSFAPSVIFQNPNATVNGLKTIASAGQFSSHKEGLPDSLQFLPVPTQERLLLEDLLSVFLGLDGKYLSVAETTPPGNTYVDATDCFEYSIGKVDQSLAVICQKMLPLGVAFIVASRFVEEKNSTYEYGMVRSIFPHFQRFIVPISFLMAF